MRGPEKTFMPLSPQFRQDHEDTMETFTCTCAESPAPSSDSSTGCSGNDKPLTVSNPAARGFPVVGVVGMTLSAGAFPRPRLARVWPLVAR